jgi:DNA polymerase I
VKKALLIDGHSLAYRAFFAVNGLTSKSGQPTNALFGFASMVLQIVKNHSPQQVYIAFDLPSPTFRHNLYKEYKATREKPPEEFISQIPLIKEFVKVAGFPIIEQAGYEADDLIGSLANKLSALDYSVFIVTGDKDAFQLVTKNIHVLLTKKGISEIDEYGEQEIVEKYSLRVNQMIDLKALMGDNSDNIPGAKGIGEKTAIKLLLEYNTLDNIYDNIDKIQGKLKEKLEQSKENVYLSKELATIKKNIEIETNNSETILNEQPLLEFLEQYELYSVIRKFLGSEHIRSNDNGSYKTTIIDKENILNTMINTLKKKKEIYIYCEYDDRTNDMIALCLTAENEDVFIIPLGFSSGNYQSFDNNNFGPMFQEDAPNILEQIKEILESPNKKIIHDVKKLMHLCDKEKIKLSDPYEDISIMAYLLDPDRANKDIDNLLKVYFREDSLTKKDILSKKYHLCEISADKATNYLSKNVFSMIKIYKQLLLLLKKENLIKLYNDMEIPLIKILFDMEKEGILLDKKYLKEMSIELHKELKEIEQTIYLEAGEEFNINSTKQLQEILFNKLQIPSIRKTKTGQSTNYDVLEELAHKYPIANSIITYRKVSKLLNTYIDSLPKLTDANNRLHTTFNSTITATGRLSSSEPNLQNIPIRGEMGGKIRGAFKAKEGYTLVVADYSQIELRILAHISEDEKLINAFKQGLDIHSSTASAIFNIDIEKVTSEMRRKAKEINFGLAYGMGAYKMSYRLGIDIKEAQYHIENYFHNFPRIKEYMEQTPKIVAENGYIETLYGRKRYFKNFATSSKQEQAGQVRMIINYPMQGLAADIIKIAMIQLENEIKVYNARVLLQVHDELILEAEKNIAEKIKDLTVKIMENSYKLSVPLIVNASISENWLDAK